MTARRVIRDLSSVLMVSGVLLLLDAGLTLVWQEPVTAVIGLIQRAGINKSFLSYTTHPLSRTDTAVLGALPSPQRRISFLARREQQQVTTGAAIGTIHIPKIGVAFDIVEGTDTTSLEKGPGHYPQTAFPGLGQTVAIAGHRTTYLAPFRNINALHRGDKIVLAMPYATFTYVVQYQKIVVPTALWVTDDVSYERLVLSACNPLYSAAQRIIIFARLAGERPSRAALGAA